MNKDEFYAKLKELEMQLDEAEGAATDVEYTVRKLNRTVETLLNNFEDLDEFEDKNKEK